MTTKHICSDCGGEFPLDKMDLETNVCHSCVRGLNLEWEVADLKTKLEWAKKKYEELLNKEMTETEWLQAFWEVEGK